MAELRQIRRKGYAESEGEIEVGVSSLSVPVFNVNGEVEAGLTIAGPSFRLKKADRRRMLNVLQGAGQRLAEAIASARAPLRVGRRVRTLSR
jgi:DNA-binding IclR family transcriptional regulator